MAESWKEKLNKDKDLPKIQKIDEKMSKRWGTGTFVIAKPIEIYEIMKKVPKGKLITINEIRQILAQKYETDIACPITTGIFAWVSANAAEEERQEGKKRILPYWRTLKTGGILNHKYPGGLEKQIELLEAEGHTVVPKGRSGKYFMVADYEEAIVKM